ncbi:MAG: copper resistance CopC/CopD family protein, partial [Candidatus Rokuibacteriota bacterium]
MNERTSSRRRGLLGLVVVFLVLAIPGSAKAHAAIVSSQPEPGQELATTPGVVTLEFTEPLNVNLSRATVIDPTGERFEGKPAGEQEIRVPLSTNAPGVYEVEWVTVSTLDGHTLRGSFRFGVGVAPGPGAEGVIGTSPQRSDLVVALFRAVEYASLLLAIGMLLLRRLGRTAALDWVRPRLGITLVVAFLSGITVVVAEALTAAGRASPGAIVGYLTTGPSGAARTIRLLAEALALVAMMAGRGTVLFLVIAIVGLSASGHAAAVSLGVPVDAVHLLTAGLWAGGILALATLRPPGGWKGPAGRALLERFSSVAIPAFLFTVASGILRGFQELSALGDLVATWYGQVLGLKVLAVLGMVPLSVLAWRRVLGTPRLEGGRRRFRDRRRHSPCGLPAPAGPCGGDGGRGGGSPRLHLRAFHARGPHARGRRGPGAGRPDDPPGPARAQRGPRLPPAPGRGGRGRRDPRNGPGRRRLDPDGVVRHHVPARRA